MRAVLFATVAGVLGSCAETDPFVSACDDLFDALCQHEVNCQRAIDVTTCINDQREILQCDDHKSVEDLQRCTATFDGLACTNMLLDDCYCVLCNPTNGDCEETTVDPMCEPGGVDPTTEG